MPDEAFSAEFRAQIHSLNEIVYRSGEPLEGGLFYLNRRPLNPPPEETPPCSSRQPKRGNFAKVLRRKTRLLEIGFNAGHSSLFALSSFPSLRVAAIDICRHSYTRPCADRLSELFGDRFCFLAGDSATVFPLHYLDLADCDIIHIDGGHGVDAVAIDLAHSVFLPNTSGAARHLLIDDFNHPPIAERTGEYINRDLLVCEWSGDSQALLRVPRGFRFQTFRAWLDVVRNQVSRRRVD